MANYNHQHMFELVAVSVVVVEEVDLEEGLVVEEDLPTTQTVIGEVDRFRIIQYMCIYILHGSILMLCSVM